MDRRDIIVIGASAGGVEAVTQVVRMLPADLPASIFVVLHISPRGHSMLPSILARSSRLPVVQATDHAPILSGHVYVAPPDRHLLLRRGSMRLSQGPKENWTRPAIDPLFRSAALHYGPSVIGVVLTGFLDDGTAGLAAVKARGGIAIVQDPASAHEPSMPRSAMEHVQVDHVVAIADLAALLTTLAGQPAPQSPSAENTEALAVEDRIAEGRFGLPPELRPEKLRHPSPYACPECHGVLFEVEQEEMLRFRCRVGHAYGAESLFAAQNGALDQTLWTALRALEESAALSRRLAERSRRRGDSAEHDRLLHLAAERQHHAAHIRETLLQDTGLAKVAED